MRSIALSGGMGAGKSAVADFLVESYGYEAVKISQPIYEIAEKLWGPEAAKDRAKLQDLGMKMREIDPDVWLNYYVRIINNRTPYHHEEYAPPVVNDTVRFPNEYWALREAGFYMVRVQAPEAVRIDRLQKIGRIQEIDRINHESETALFGVRAESEGIRFDYELNNDTDKVNMEREVRNLMNKIEREE